MFEDSIQRKNFLQISLRLFCLIIVFEIMWAGIEIWKVHGFFSLPSLYSTIVNSLIFVLSIYLFADLKKIVNILLWSWFFLTLPYLVIDQTSNFLGLDKISEMSHRFEAYKFRKSKDYDIKNNRVPSVFGGYETDQEKIYKTPLIFGEIYPLRSIESENFEKSLKKKNEVVETEPYIFWQSALIRGFKSSESTKTTILDILISPITYFVDVINEILPLFLLSLVLQLLVFRKGYLNFIL